MVLTITCTNQGIKTGEWDIQLSLHLFTNVHPQPQLLLQPPSLFVLCFISGSISTCFGCKIKYPKSLQPPADLCIRHQDWRKFFSTNTKSNMQTKYVMFITIASWSVCGCVALSLYLLIFNCLLPSRNRYCSW